MYWPGSLTLFLVALVTAALLGHQGLVQQAQALISALRFGAVPLLLMGGYCAWVIGVGLLHASQSDGTEGSAWVPVEATLATAALIPAWDSQSAFGHALLWAVKLGASV